MFTANYRNILTEPRMWTSELTPDNSVGGERTWILFLDDERYPAEPDCMLARTSYDAIRFTSDWGMPVEMRLDHDLGGDDTAMEYLNWLEGELDSGDAHFPKGFSYSIHSQNPIGATNIKNRMEFLLKYF